MKRTAQATGVGCRREDWLTTGAAGPSQDILPACHTKYPWKKNPMLGCTDGCQAVPQLLPRCFCTHKWWEPILNLRIEVTEQESNPKTTMPLQEHPESLFCTCFFVQWWYHAVWWLVYVENQKKGEDEFELKEGLLDQFSRIVQVAHRQDNINS